MARFIRSTDDALINLDHVAVLLVRQLGGQGQKATYLCVAPDGRELGVVYGADLHPELFELALERGR